MTANVATLKRLNYLLGVFLIVVQIPIAYLNIKAGDYHRLLIRGSFAGFGVYVIMREYSGPTAREIDFDTLESRVDPDLRPAIRFVVVTIPVFKSQDKEIDDVVALAADEYDVDEDRLARATKEIVADMEIKAKTGQFPDE